MKMAFVKRGALDVWTLFSFILLIIHIDAIEQKVTCANLNKSPHINDVYYEYIANDNCETVLVSSSDSIFSTATPTIDLELKSKIHEVNAKFMKKSINTSLRKPRSENTDEIMPTSVLDDDTGVATSDVAEERQNNPNADIQDIITGIVKLLNGNVNVHANTQHIPPTSMRRYATRINNRGPPRVSDYPVIMPIEEKYGNMKTTPYPTGIRKPPIIPYPFDMVPPEPKPPRTNNEHTILVHNNKPMQPNRLPWHGSRTRPPIQISNTNRMQMHTRLPHQPTLDFRPPSSKTANPPVAYSTQTPDITANKSREILPSESQSINLFEQISSSHSEQSLREASIQEKYTNSTLLPRIESSINVAKPHVDMLSSSRLSTTPPLEKIMPKTNTFTSIQRTSTVADKITKPVESLPTPKSTQHSIQRDNKMNSTIPISPSRVTEPIQQIESTNFKSFYARPGIVLDDTDFSMTRHTPGMLEPSTQYHHIHQNTNIQSTATLSDIFAEIFDVTLSAIQGQPNTHHKVVDLIELANTQRDSNPVIVSTRYGGNDIIVSASDDNSFVSIDGKRTYINLFGETAETEHLKNPSKTQTNHPNYQQTTKTASSVTEKTNSIPVHKKPTGSSKPIINHSLRPHLPASPIYRKQQQNAVRIDTCIVGDDSTCDLTQNEVCKTDLGVSSCHCKPGYSRRKYRDPCRRVLSLLMSMRIDKYYTKPIVWDKTFADSSSEQFEIMSYETMRAVDSVMSMTPFSDDFISARVHNMYTGNASQGSPGVYMNMTIELDGNTESARKYIQSDLQKELIAVIHRRQNNIGNSALYVDQPAGSISSLQDLDECSSIELNDCHPNAKCTNTWGIFECKCMPGLRDPWSDQRQKAGRECISCSNSYCNNRGTCQYDDSGIQLTCICMNNFYGSQCEIDGDILAFSIGASIIAVLIITLTLVCLVMWGRRWNQEQKEMIGSPIFNYITRANLDTHVKAMQSKTYQAQLEDRMRWAQIAEVMSKSNHYAVEPAAPQRVQPAPLYVYQSIHRPNNVGNLTSLSMAGTLPVRSRGMSELSIPVSRMDMEATSKIRRHENTSSSEEDDLVDLLGNTCQSPSGIYYDVDCESSDHPHGNSTLQENGGPLYSLSNAPRVPMSTYTPNPRMFARN